MSGAREWERAEGRPACVEEGLLVITFVMEELVP